PRWPGPRPACTCRPGSGPGGALRARVLLPRLYLPGEEGRQPLLYPGRPGGVRATNGNRFQALGVAIGKEPRTVTSWQCSARALSARDTLGSSAWPSKSTKKMYSDLATLDGNDSIQVRLIR